MIVWIVRLRPHDGRLIETGKHETPEAALAAYRALLSRDDLIGQPLAAVFKPPAGLVTSGNTSTWFSRFDRDIGDGRLSALDPRLDAYATAETANQVLHSQPPTSIDFTAPIPDLIRAAKTHLGITTRELAERLDAPYPTVRGWEQGDSVPKPEGMARIAFRAICGER